MIFFTASLWLMLSLLAPRSSGDEMDGPYGSGPHGYSGDEIPPSPGTDVDEASPNEVEMLKTLLGDKESGKNLLGRLIGMEESKGHGHEQRHEEREGEPNLGDVINDLCQVTPRLVRIFPVISPVGNYKYDFAEAKHACEQQGATLATYHQLLKAWQDGLEHCACGWLSDGTSRFPMQTKQAACGNNAGINTCDWAPNLWDAWCFRTLSICE